MPIIKRWNKSAKNSFCHFGFRRNNRIFALPNRCVGRVVRRRSAKPVTVVRFRYAPQETPISIAERGFAILDLATTLLQIKKTPNHFIDSESGGIQNEVAFRQQHLSQRYSNFSINQSLTIFVSGTGELNN